MRDFVDRLLVADVTAQYAPAPIERLIAKWMPHGPKRRLYLCDTLLKLGARKLAI
ncbi:hypothetical protein [Cryobacterium sp. TMT1-66-1]|uniref:hypothetical protein n=1 Tax=Cryobacterium sp. TMT1-66-1 TaxID=1259242 RepID=UPI00141AC33E|nr:hypothetical protein [Cryobacterium sp. TMT1-66-1]